METATFWGAKVIVKVTYHLLTLKKYGALHCKQEACARVNHTSTYMYTQYVHEAIHVHVRVHVPVVYRCRFSAASRCRCD